MKYKYQLIAMFASAVMLAVACSSANFGGTTAAPSKTEDPNSKSTSGDPNDPTKKSGSGGVDERGAPKCSNDQVKLKLSSEQEKCIVEQGKTWDFKNSRCANLPKADFPCDWANVIANLSKYPKSLVTPTLQTASTDGSKLVTCSQGTEAVDTSGKKYIRYAIQFVSAGSDAKNLECEGTPANEVSITTGCYTYADGGAIPIAIPDSSDKAAYENYVYNCVNNLGPTP